MSKPPEGKTNESLCDTNLRRLEQTDPSTASDAEHSDGRLAIPNGSGVADTNGGKLFYEVRGSGPAVVLIPAYGFDTRCWDDQVGPLSQANTVVRYDPRGFGRSSQPAEDDHYSHQEDLAGLLDRLRIRQAHIVGNSNGGRIAIGFALAYPERTASLVAADPALDGTWPPSEIAAYFGQAHETALSRGIDAAKEELITTMPAFLPAMSREALASRVRTMMRDFSGWQFLRDDPERPSVPDAANRLHELHMPVLAILGELEMPYIRGVVGRLADEAPHAQRLDIAGAGHFTAMEAPTAFNEAVMAFMRPQADLPTIRTARLGLRTSP